MHRRDLIWLAYQLQIEVDLRTSWSPLQAFSDYIHYYNYCLANSTLMIQIKEENKLCKTKSKNKKEFAWFDNCLNKQMANEESLTIEIRKIIIVAQGVILHLLDIEQATESLNMVQ